MEHFIEGFKTAILFPVSDVWLEFLGVLFGIICIISLIVTIVKTVEYIKIEINKWRK